MASAALTNGPAGFKLKESPIENLRPLKVRVIGAGFSGIYLGVRIPQRIQNLDFQIYEKNEGVGGTWWENRYPGCACDVPGQQFLLESELSMVLIDLQHIHTNILSSLIQTGRSSMPDLQRFAVI